MSGRRRKPEEVVGPDVRETGVRATVLVRPKQGILDPQGEAVQSSLVKLGFAVSRVRVGRVIDVELEAEGPEEARRSLERMCADLLANPLIESFEIRIEAEGDEDGGGAANVEGKGNAEGKTKAEGKGNAAGKGNAEGKGAAEAKGKAAGKGNAEGTGEAEGKGNREGKGGTGKGGADKGEAEVVAAVGAEKS